jgi:hypothetical protein
VKFAFILFALFYLVGFVLLGYASWAAWKSSAAGRWPRTKGVVTRCEVKTSSGGKGGVTYRVEVEYTYEVARRSYTGDRLAYGYAGGGNHDVQHQI